MNLQELWWNLTWIEVIYTKTHSINKDICLLIRRWATAWTVCWHVPCSCSQKAQLDGTFDLRLELNELDWTLAGLHGVWVSVVFLRLHHESSWDCWCCLSMSEFLMTVRCPWNRCWGSWRILLERCCYSLAPQRIAAVECIGRIVHCSLSASALWFRSMCREHTVVHSFTMFYDVYAMISCPDFSSSFFEIPARSKHNRGCLYINTLKLKRNLRRRRSMATWPWKNGAN